MLYLLLYGWYVWYNVGMYIRTIQRKNKDGSVVRYIQLAHNQWDPQARCAKAKVLFNFGREEEVDREALKRLVKSINRFLGPGETLRYEAETGAAPLKFITSRPLGGAWVLDRLWEELGIKGVLETLLKKRQYKTPVERAIFAMAANRALDPMSKRGVEEWVKEDAVIPGVEEIPLQQLYRAMDFLLENEAELQKQVYYSVANLLNLEVDILYFDTTSTYFEIEDEDEDGGLRRRGHSKDHRPDLPQAVIGLAVTRDGIPVRCWVWPGNTADISVVEQVKKDLIGWKLGRVITVLDRGFNSEDNLRCLQRAGGHYIAGEKLRSGKENTVQALKRGGRYQTVRDNLEVKEIVVGNGEARERYILVRNPEEAARDKARREKIIKELEEQLPHIKTHAKAVCELMAHPVYGRYLKLDSRSLPKIDRAKIREEEKLDGKYLLRTSDDTLSAEDVALGYKQLLLVEDAFRTLKSRLELRPVYHRLEDRIRSHVLLCWLALLLIRIAENRTGQTWCSLRATLQRMQLGEFSGTAGQVRQRTETTPAQKQIFKALAVKEPPLLFSINPTAKKNA
ncbi:transposase, IS4 family [Thermacetogenium phaeum DSM 12270]|uniref:Transposase, IS4 family n=1 Tax=Thermacetogenium phaeum (strain ATCC BAA-254 / DSM 26808 / PB) TaxID=1089553 RepID=K4LX65_THEPS|nr:transposase, IS4 family [Thermacetogenium phaeum DSM 12270]